jgi:gliding motility-associated-like protein
MKVKYLVSLLVVYGLFFFPTKGQCDLVLTDVNIEEGTFTIDFVNTTNCGGTGGPDGVSEIQIGFQALDPENGCAAMNQGWTFPSGITIPDNSSHPGWIFSSTSTESPTNWSNLYTDEIAPPYYAGEVVTFPLYNPYQNDCSEGAFWSTYLTCQLQDALQFWIDEGLSIQAVIWQISYGPTMYAEDGGWAEVGANGDGTSYGVGLYEDENFEDNIFIVGPCADPSPGPDAVVANIEFNIGCIGDVPAYSLDYQIINLGDEAITDYCIEIWNEDYYQCFNSELFGAYEIPPGEGQSFSTPFFQYEGGGNIFVVSVDSVNGTDEIITGNNNTTVYYPEFPTCPIDCPTDTIIELQVDTIYVPWEWYFYDTVYVDNFIYDTTYIQLPPDTIVIPQIVYLTDTVTIVETELIYDTLYIDNYIYEYDTIYVDIPYIDTVYVTETEYIVDTLYITELVTITDTITEYVVQELWIDCNTGLPCDEDPPGLDCPGWATLHVPNTFTPNNDGLNDVWKIIYDLNCWEDIEFEIYNRWGNKVYHGYGESYDSYPYWDGSVNGSNYYVKDGVYVYLIRGKKVGRTEVVKKQGFISIFR